MPENVMLNEIPNELPSESPHAIPQEVSKKIEIKNTVNHLIKGLLLYILIFFTVYLLYDIIIYIISTVCKDLNLIDISPRAFTNNASSSYIPYIISLFIGVHYLRIRFKHLKLEFEIINSKRKIPIRSFFMLLCLYMSVQIVTTFLDMGVEFGLNQIGLSIANQIADVSKMSTTISGFLCVSFLGPIAEEIIFRGFIMRGLEKYGKLFAIVISSIIFGAFHGNFSQGVHAATVGLILGYVAMEYSISYSILMHITNNFIFCELYDHMVYHLSITAQWILFYFIYGIFFVVAIIILIKKRTKLKNYISVNKTERGRYRYALSSLWLIIFFVLELLQGISGIKKL